MVRFVAMLTMIVSGASTLSQDKTNEYELPDSTSIASIFHEAAPKEIRVKSHVNSSGQVVVTAQLSNISITNTSMSNLPKEGKKPGDWMARFVVVPKFSDMNIKEINQAIKLPSGSKVTTAIYRRWFENIPNLVSELHGYRIYPSALVPTEENDKALVKQFIARLSKSLRATGKERDTEKFLQQFLLDEH